MVHTHWQHDSVGASPDCGGHRHGAVHTELTHDVICGRDHSPLLGRATDNDRSASQFRAVAFLDGRIEGVHVDMQDHLSVSCHTRRACSPITGGGGRLSITRSQHFRFCAALRAVCCASRRGVSRDAVPRGRVYAMSHPVYALHRVQIDAAVAFIGSELMTDDFRELTPDEWKAQADR